MTITPIKVIDTIHIRIDGLSDQQIEKEKERLIREHSGKMISSLGDFPSEKATNICLSRYYFIEMNGCIIL